jgi:hypothetical protein
MHRQDAVYKKDKRALVLFALGVGILAVDWFTHPLIMDHSRYFWQQPENHASPVVITTALKKPLSAESACEFSKNMACSITPPRLALFFDLPVPLNRADYLTLTMLPGIGRKRAENILKFRARQGPIIDAGMLARVEGISRKLSGRLEPMLCFN